MLYNRHINLDLRTPAKMSKNITVAKNAFCLYDCHFRIANRKEKPNKHDNKLTFCEPHQDFGKGFELLRSQAFLEPQIIERVCRKNHFSVLKIRVYGSCEMCVCHSTLLQSGQEDLVQRHIRNVQGISF